MEKYNELVLPVATETHQSTDPTGTLTTVEFLDGTHTAEVDFGSYRDLIVSDAEGIVPKPDEGRYPFTERLARLALEHLDEHGKFPSFLLK